MPELIPVVDLAAADAPERLDAACRSIGFMSIVGHGVPGPVIDEMLAETDEFFALPLAEKLSLRSPSPGINRGYAAKGTEGLTYSLGVAIFGGFTPAIITALISWTAQPVSVAFYLMGAALISLVTVMTLRDRTGEVLS